MKLLIFFIYVAFAYCNYKEKIIIVRKDAQAEPINTGKFISSIQKLKNVFKISDCISLRSREPLVITHANKVVFRNNKYFLADFKTATIDVFDSDGNFLYSIGSRGMGAGRYPTIEGFNIDGFNNEILVYSLEKQSLMTYSLRGKFLFETHLDFYAWDFAVLDSSHLVFYLNQNRNEQSGNYDVLITDRKGTILQRLFNWRPLPPMAFDYTGFIQQQDNSILFSLPFSDSVFEFKDGMAYPKYSISLRNAFPDSIKYNHELLTQNILRYSFLQKPVFENARYLTIPFVEDSMGKVAIYNKNTKMLIRSDQFDGDLEYFLFRSTGLNESTFYSVVDLNELRNTIKSHPNTEVILKSLHPKFYSAFKDTINSNPIIVSFQFTF